MNIQWHHHSSLDSTNTWAKAHRASFDKSCLHVITCDEQTKGRGRHGRPWQSSKGQNSLLSFALFWPHKDFQPFSFSQATALCVSDLLLSFGIESQIKWPNDLLVEGKKIAGILVEVEPLENCHYIIVGCGLNINMPVEELELLPKKATSMYVETGHPFDVQAVQRTFVDLFVQKLQEAIEFGFQQSIDSWHQRVQWMVSQHAIVQTHFTTVEGSIVEIIPDGNLLLETSTGQIFPIHSGEIFC
ncbi:MAG: biotin--[acetyl-CoA-carboxylase] ligase [Verrucomicrobia bacterium]|nr:biotin--[acetyl-CoA-carboxylase] ligase [Verrucomicrobiota bacterium]